MPDAHPPRSTATAAPGLGPRLALGLGLGLHLALAPPLLAQTSERSETLDRYVAVAAAAFFAEGNCPGLHADAGRITTLRLATRIAAAEEESVAARLRARAALVRLSFAQNGRAAWCEEVYGLLGPDGTAARGVVVQAR